jgi:broad specificity phosphatase PhoE
MKRALETASIIAARHRLVVESSRELREIDFGAWEGRDLSELWLEDSAAARSWELDVRHTPPSFGETVISLERRVAAFWRRTLPAAGEVAIVGHGGSLAALRSLISHEPLAQSIASRLEPGGMIGLDA